MQKIKILPSATEKEAPQGNILEFFLLDILKTAFGIENLKPNMDTIRAFLSKIKALFPIVKKGRGGFPSPPSCAPVIVAEYASISLNIPKYP